MFALCGCLEGHRVFTTVDVITMIAISSYYYRSHYYKPRSTMINVTPQTSRLHSRHRPYPPTHPTNSHQVFTFAPPMAPQAPHPSSPAPSAAPSYYNTPPPPEAVAGISSSSLLI
ncbi:hypothetical protein ABVK25_000489 [Lepraria finkii]|uniref:Uncharacterized protein n=1 Tax=Lepraria finkii TaxID=1340010 RepID=A0ABR4BN21_9LECA